MPSKKGESPANLIKSGEFVKIDTSSMGIGTVEEVLYALSFLRITSRGPISMKDRTVYADKKGEYYATKEVVKKLKWYFSNYCGELEVRKFFRKQDDADAILKKLPSFIESLGNKFYMSSFENWKRKVPLDVYYDAVLFSSDTEIVFFNKELKKEVSSFLSDLRKDIESSISDSSEKIKRLFQGKKVERLKTSSDSEAKFSVKGKKKSLFLSILKDGTNKFGSLRFDGGVLSDEDLASFNKFLDESKNGQIYRAT